MLRVRVRQDISDSKENRAAIKTMRLLETAGNWTSNLSLESHDQPSLDQDARFCPTVEPSNPVLEFGSAGCAEGGLEVLAVQFLAFQREPTPRTPTAPRLSLMDTSLKGEVDGITFALTTSYA